MSNTSAAARFSIFHPVISFEHREFYEEIVGQLNGLFPICNQGKCAAVEISDNATEQEQITDLMSRVENFAGELLEVTKRLFDQFYRGKEGFSNSIFLTTAYNKINLMDRNLLERTCDVRWWSQESAFCKAVTAYEESVSTLKTVYETISELIAERSSDTSEGRQLITVCEACEHPDKVLLDPVLRGRLAEDCALASQVVTQLLPDSPVIDLLRQMIGRFGDLAEHLEFASSRLKTIRSSYTLYRELVITDLRGVVLASSSADQRPQVVGLNVSDEEWFARAIDTNSGAEYFAQDIASSKVEEQLALVYSTAVREGGRSDGPVLGTMGVFFDFQGEAKLILDGYMPKNRDGTVSEGWYSFFTNTAGQVIASSDTDVLKAGEVAHVPRKHRQLSGGARANTYAIIEGVESALYSANTEGYLDYKGLGWTSHVVLPRTKVFEDEVDEAAVTLEDEIMESLLIPDISKKTYLKVQEDKESIQLISLNGMVFASKLGRRGIALGPIFDQITKIGDVTTARMEQLLLEMAKGEFHLNLRVLQNLAKRAIDLVDRNLFGRAADIRWWATDSCFWEALEEGTPEKVSAAAERLNVINGTYTMYRNLVLANANGEIVACARTDLQSELKRLSVGDREWFHKGMRTERASDYAVQDVTKSPLEKDKDASLVYAAGVRAQGAEQGESLGVLGVFFDWDTEARKILDCCLPCSPDGEAVQGTVAAYTNAAGIVIESTNYEVVPLGKPLQAERPLAELGAGQSTSGTLELESGKYVIGSACTGGYREYAGLAWSAHVLLPR